MLLPGDLRPAEGREGGGHPGVPARTVPPQRAAGEVMFAQSFALPQAEGLSLLSPVLA